MMPVAHWQQRLHHIGAHLTATGHHGYGSELAAIARFIVMQDDVNLSQRETMRMMRDRYAGWTPPPLPVVQEFTFYASGERIKGDM